MRNLFIFFLLIGSTSVLQANPEQLSPAEIGSTDGIVNTFYDLISGKAGQRNWNKMRALCLPKAQFNIVRYNKEGKLINRFGTISEYIDNTNVFFKKNPYFQTETARKLEQFGNTATVFSTFNSDLTYTGSGRKVNESGIMTFQLVFAKERWWISSVFWNTLPPETGTNYILSASNTTNTSNSTSTANTSTGATVSTTTATVNERLDVDRPIRFESGVDGEIFNENEVSVAPKFGEADAAIYKYLGENMTMPEDASGQGSYTIEFVVDTDGWLTNMKIYNSKSQEMVNQFLEAFGTMPKWAPAKKDGKPVNCRVTLSLNLK